MSEISFTAPQPGSSDEVQPTVAPEPIKPAPAKQPKADKYKPYNKL